jgi:hypothetical protein
MSVGDEDAGRQEYSERRDDGKLLRGDSRVLLFR